MNETAGEKKRKWIAPGISNHQSMHVTVRIEPPLQFPSRVSSVRRHEKVERFGPCYLDSIRQSFLHHHGGLLLEAYPQNHLVESARRGHPK